MEDYLGGADLELRLSLLLLVRIGSFEKATFNYEWGC